MNISDQGLLRLLGEKIRLGTLSLTLSDGSVHQFGSGTPLASWEVHQKSVSARLLRDPELELGETYMEGGWSPGPQGLRALMTVLMRNFQPSTANRKKRLESWLRQAFQQSNRIALSYRNAAHHYDLDEWFFRRFLDPELFYSSGYFLRPEASLEEAQAAKCRLIMDKLCLEPGQKVLDIGSGWGGLARFLAQQAGVEVVGLTLSREQLRVAREITEARGLSGQVRFLLQDYREHQGEYDRIVSVGMFEHVGRRHYDEFFSCLGAKLRPDGVALLHTIGSVAPPSETNPWIRRHIFPGGYNPSLSEVTRAIEDNGLIHGDVEILRLHYALTLEQWYQRFQEHRSEITQRMGQPFHRMWEFYLAISEMAFRYWDLVVFHLQLGYRDSRIPITRDYLYCAQDSVARSRQDSFILKQHA